MKREEEKKEGRKKEGEKGKKKGAGRSKGKQEEGKRKNKDLLKSAGVNLRCADAALHTAKNCCCCVGRCWQCDVAAAEAAKNCRRHSRVKDIHVSGTCLDRRFEADFV